MAGTAFIVVVYLLACLCRAEGERILLVPIQLRANVYAHLAVARALQSLDHDVYMAVPTRFPWQSLSNSAGVELIKYRQRDNNTLYDSRYYQLLSDEVNGAKNFRAVPYRAEEYKSVVVDKMCRWMAEDKEFIHEIKFMNFDVALVDVPVSCPCNVFLPYSLAIPFVALSSVYLPHTSAPHFPSFVPDLASEYSDRMTFWQRLDNLLLHRRLNDIAPFTGARDASLLKTFGSAADRSSPVTWQEVVAEASLFITLRDHVLEWPTPRMPNHVLLPGILQQPGKPLPDQLESFVNDAPHGLILVAFGSLYDRLDQSIVQRLFDAFRKLDFHNYRVLLKMNPELQREIMTKPNAVPSNVWIVTWLPQNDVLAHPKTKLFISNCGNNGQYEALYHGVPMIGLPLYPEQHHNCVRMHRKGFGICMDTWTFTAEMLAHNFDLLTNRRSYREQIQNSSAILKHGPLPSQSAAFWIEHVAKYGGYHLQSGIRDLSFYQIWMVDIWFFYMVSILVVMATIGLLIFTGLTFVKRKLKME